MTTRRPVFSRRPCSAARIAWRTWMPWYEPGRLIGEAQDTCARAQGLLPAAGALVVVTTGLVLALPALALVWPVVGAGALLALLLAAPGDPGEEDAVAGQVLLQGPDTLVQEVGGKSVLNTLLSVVEERGEGKGYGNNGGHADTGAVELPRLLRVPERDGGVRGQDGRTGAAGVGACLGDSPVPAHDVRHRPGRDKPGHADLEETGLGLVLGADTTGGWADA